jgi:DNA-binding PadR family transcriptional regulator
VAVSKVEVVVLGLLADDSLYGYELLERFRDRSMGFWVEVGKASVYQALARLERNGLVSGKDQEGREGPDRRVFRLTKAGRERLDEGLAERFGELAPYETGAGTALGFLTALPAPDARKAAEARERAVRDFLAAIADERSRAAGERDADRSLATALLDRQQALGQAELAWLKTFKSSLARRRR